jgi:hypothetical protein
VTVLGEAIVFCRNLARGVKTMHQVMLYQEMMKWLPEYQLILYVTFTLGLE